MKKRNIILQFALAASLLFSTVTYAATASSPKDIPVGSSGQNKVNDTVTAGKRDGSHQTHADQFRNQSIITVWENNTDYTCV